MSVTSSAREAATSIFQAATTTANVLGESVAMLADLTTTGRAYTRELSFAARVREAVRKPHIRTTVATEATVDLVKRRHLIDQELAKDPALKALFDLTFAEVSAAANAIN